MSADEVADRLVSELRADGMRDVDSASCQERQASGGRQYVCSVSGSDSLLGLFSYVVTVDGDRIEYRRRLDS